MGFLIIFGVLGFCVVIAVVPSISLLIGLPWVFSTFAEDITHELAFLNGKNLSSYRNGSEFKKRFCNSIELYSDLKELSCRKSRIND